MHPDADQHPLQNSGASSARCDCHALKHPTGVQPTGLAVHAHGEHLRRRLRLALVAHDLNAAEQYGDLIVPRSAFDRLEVLLAAFSGTERLELMAAPWDGARLDPWQLAPLEQWARRLQSDWFPAAAEQLVFHLQPVVQLQGGQVYGYEALVRANWQGELLGAGTLLQAATAHNQTRAFDALARRGAIRQAYPQLEPDQQLFINFAPGVIYNPDICLTSTFDTCREVGADFSRLVFEVTESEAFPDLRLLRRILERYRAEGAQVALDDLGAGHTSLSYLAELQPDLVKLDRALIHGLHGADHRVPLVTALIRYAHDLGIRVVAEGIETGNELQLVRELGADYGQGYFLGRPEAQTRQVLAQAAGYLVS
ncbi:EAL domain-containing protein [Deinococcus sonorensis]|uniref:EAL domain-containing protein n=2 Tax=Deinococcus sonorensis TaxID=309891 RepID=A0AAU7UGR2_9DEIO